MSTTTPRETFLDRIGIPHSLRWGFLGVLVFMTGNGTESNFISPHIEALLGSPEDTVAAIIAAYGVAVLVGSYLAGALADLWSPRRVMTMGVVVWVVFEVLFLLSLQLGSTPLAAVSYFFRGFGYPSSRSRSWCGSTWSPRTRATAWRWAGSTSCSPVACPPSGRCSHSA